VLDGRRSRQTIAPRVTPGVKCTPGCTRVVTVLTKEDPRRSGPPLAEPLALADELGLPRATALALLQGHIFLQDRETYRGTSTPRSPGAAGPKLMPDPPQRSRRWISVLTTSRRTQCRADSTARPFDPQGSPTTGRSIGTGISTLHRRTRPRVSVRVGSGLWLQGHASRAR